MEPHRARTAQADPGWKADYKATRPKVERKIGHLMRRRHGGRHARVRGTTKVAADFSLLAAAVNLARIGVLGLRQGPDQTWVTMSRLSESAIDSLTTRVGSIRKTWGGPI